MGTSADFEQSFEQFYIEINDEFTKREDIRGVVRDLEQKGREMFTLVQKVHRIDGLKDTDTVAVKLRELFDGVRTSYRSLASIVPPMEYYRYNDCFRWTTQRFVQIAAFLRFLEKSQLLTREEAAALIGVEVSRRDGFHLDVEDYLCGLLMMANELSRFAVNCVTAGDYERPYAIAEFLSHLDAGFRLLNLKNDALRKKFDGLKYDVKKVEEVVYDIKIRGLHGSAPAAADSQVMPPERGGR